jgi:iron complex outermembrane receptor protein
MPAGAKLATAFIITAAAITAARNASAQSADTAATMETVVVTGSRVIADATRSPTPLTVVSTEQLEQNTPGNIADGLNKLPVFTGSQTRRLVNNASNNSASNSLNLRNFGPQRTLVLLDGQRVGASNANGTVNIDTLPQALVQRVEVVTGGASAVYGSDAVTGVVNFILDKKFNGIKFNANSGVSALGDARENKIAIAAGTSLFGGRGHIEGSFDFDVAEPVYNSARPEDGQDGAWVRSGSGTAASPYIDQRNGKLASLSFGGKITACGTGCAANNAQFIANGVIGPFDPGVATATNNISSGGDGVYNEFTNLVSYARMAQAFTRFSYDITDETVLFLHARAAETVNRSNFTDSLVMGPGPNTFFKSNPYLPAAAQALLNTGTGTTFRLGKYNRNVPTNQTFGNDRALSLSTGLDGTVFKDYDWHVYFGHSEDRLKISNPHNVNNQLLYAAQDVVLNSAGTPVCRVSTTAFANLYPGCVPANQFGPTSLTTTAYNYYAKDTNLVQTTTLDDLSGSIAGEVFNLPAGAVRASLSGEARWLGYQVDSTGSPDNVNCTGLASFCDPTVTLWQNNVATGIPKVSGSVWEIAAEVNLPLLKDLAAVQSLSANLAGRYTNYSTSGGVNTWKLGLDWHVNDSLRFRATNSVDIRAPTLRDLYSPTQISQTGFNDLHTGTTAFVSSASTGNEALVPEVARTYTAGLVLTPSFIPRFTASIDYYNIDMKNAISSISASTPAIQLLCEASGGSSQYCALAQRPLPFSDRSPANFPTLIYSKSLNSSFQKAAGWDLELNYAFELANVVQALPGSLQLRLIGNYQPTTTSQGFPGAPLTLTPASKGHITSFASYAVGNWNFNLEDRWLSSFFRGTLESEEFARPRVATKNYVDISVNRKFAFAGIDMSGYLAVQNVFNIEYPTFPTVVNIPGHYYKGVQGPSTSAYDAIGRYFTLGIRGRF